MTLYYEGSDGSKVNLMGDGIYAQNPETLTQNTWEYSSMSGSSGLARVKRFYKDAKELPLTVGIMAEDKEEFNAMMYNIHRIFDRDVRRLKPGKLWWNDWYKEVFAVDTSNDSFEELFESVDRDITFLAVGSYWVRKVVRSYEASTGTGTDSLDYGLDYGFDYDHDYGVDNTVEVVENDCIDAANFEIRFYGPVANPSVSISGHVYEVFDTLSEGEYITVNSLTKKILKYDQYGNETNVFHLRGRDDYIFQKIPEGVNTITRSGVNAMDITIYDERGEPEWI